MTKSSTREIKNVTYPRKEKPTSPLERICFGGLLFALAITGGSIGYIVRVML